MAITSPSTMGMAAAPVKAALSTNYIDFTSDAGNNGWQQQFLPDLMEKEAEVFGNRTISGFLSQVGAEESMSSDQVVWSEQGRLHLSYQGIISNTAGQVTIQTDIDGNALTTTHGIRINDMVLLSTAAGTIRGMVTDGAGATNDIITVLPYEGVNLAATVANGGLGATGSTTPCTILVFGSEFSKGTQNFGAHSEGARGVQPSFQSFSNKPIIIKEYYEINGSDASQIGWVEVSGEDGQNGYLWYLKAAGDTRQRFGDYLEMTMMEAVKGVPASSAIDQATNANAMSNAFPGTGNPFGTQGLFDAIDDRGNVATGVLGTSCTQDLIEFDNILAEFDNQGAIEENMMFLNRTTALAVDDMLACMNSYGTGGSSYGVFDNSEDMALNLGFSGFRRGSYDFYKSDWKYLNDKATRGSINSRDSITPVRGVIVPAGVSSVYDQQLGKNLKRPFLHVRYRASQTESRKYKTWTTGSVGATTSDLDAMEMHFLSERCLITQGANNFMLFR